MSTNQTSNGHGGIKNKLILKINSMLYFVWTVCTNQTSKSVGTGKSNRFYTASI